MTGAPRMPEDRGDPLALDPVSRRRFLELMGASLALAGVAGCDAQPPREAIVPYVQPPERIVPGRPLVFATSLERSGYARGALAASHMGRPTKIEGNPDHPASLGATDVFMQAEVLTLYDPARSRAVLARGEPSTWPALAEALRRWLEHDARGERSRLRVLTGPVSSPTLLRRLQALLAARPGARWYVHDPVGRHAPLAGARRAFGRPLEAVPRVDRAAVIAALDCDLLFAEPGAIAHARGFARGRLLRGERPGATMNRLYVVEPSPTVTGTSADRRLALPSARASAIARALAARLGVVARDEPALGEATRELVARLAQDLERAAPRGLVVAGPAQPAAVHALVHGINAALGAVGETVHLIDPVIAPTGAGDSPGGIAELTAELEAGEVGCLVVLGEDPVYSAPGALDFGPALARAELSVHAGLWVDATARRCRWHAPLAHPLESWGDLRAFDGTASPVQPLIAPLHRGHTALEVLALLGAGDDERDDLARVQATWAERLDLRGPELRAWWRSTLERGVMEGTAAAHVAASPDREALARAWDEARAYEVEAGAGGGAAEAPLELTLAPDPTVWDGRFAGNAWLQECPKPVSKVTWSNALLVSPADAARLGLASESLARVRWRGRTVDAPVVVLRGQAEGAVRLALGYGRDLGPASAAARAGGADAYRLRDDERRWVLPGAAVEPVRDAAPPRAADVLPLTSHAGPPAVRTVPLARTQLRFEGGHERAARAASLEAFRRRPEAVARTAGEPRRGRALPTLHPERDLPGPQWGMVIDLTTCIGCNACVVACQAENNIPVVGPEEVRRGREMHWLRIDSYYVGPRQDDVVHQPVPCMHCEHAPCEVVCPTGATQHSSDGLNDMAYNRCVGTRYCSNNCPYRVRRFNFFAYTELEGDGARALQRNPNVTVRGRGVIEKCTYCVQRLRVAGIEARRQGRAIRDGEASTACQTACPTEAIVFGDITDPEAAVTRLRRSPHEYELLGELNTRPRTTYLAAIRNEPEPARPAPEDLPHPPSERGS